MIAERASAGYKQLRYSSKNTTDDIANAFPDQNRWVEYFCPGGRVPVGTFVRQLGYKDSIEYLTADLCILMPVAPQLTTDTGKSDPRVKRCRLAEDAAMFRSCGEQAHPAMVAAAAANLRTHTGGDSKSTAGSAVGSVEDQLFDGP